MTAVRQDAWSPDDDLILAEVTLRHIREGGTQLKAFEEVGERIGRTAAACGFRWNSFVRKKYEAAIQIAKSQRQKNNQMRKRSGGSVADAGSHLTEFASESGPMIKSDTNEEDELLQMDSVIRFLKKWKNALYESQRQVKQLERVLQEKEEMINELRKEKEQLSKEVNEVQIDYRTVNDDYKTLIQIMDRARKLAVLGEGEELSKPRFKMDANGNLERVE